MTDIIIGFAILALLAAVLAITVRGQQRAATKLAATRAAQRTAEDALVALQSGRRIPQASNLSITWRHLNAPPVGPFVWAEVETKQSTAAAHLIGLIPAAAPELPKGGPQ